MFITKLVLSVLLSVSQVQSGFAAEPLDGVAIVNQKTSDEIVLIGNEQYANGDMRAAITSYSQALNKDPSNLTALFNRGVAYVQLHDYSLSIEDFTRVLKDKPDYILALHARGTALRKMGQYDRAMADHDLAIGSAPNSADLLHNRALTLRKLGRVDGAVEDLGRAILLNSDFAPAYKLRADIYFQRHVYDEALGDYLNAARINPEDYGTTYNIGLSLSLLGQFPHAIEAYSRVLKIYPDHMLSLMSRADSLRLVNEHSRALVDINHAIEVDPRLGEAHRIRALIYQELGRKVDAANDFDTAARIGQMKQNN